MARSCRNVRLALVLGAGAARGLAHVGVLQVLEEEGIRPQFLTGSSMGGLIAALSACGLSAHDIAEVARSFAFPRWFVPGAMVAWETIFPAAERILRSRTFEDLRTPLALPAVDLESGLQVVLHEGPVLPAVQATCAVPGILAPVQMAGRWLVDGGLVNLLPVDVAAMADPDVVVAVKTRADPSRRVERLRRRSTRLLSRLGSWFPNPATARVSLDLVVRATEIVLDRQAALSALMAGPEVLIEPEVGDISLREFHRLDEAVEAGRRAAGAAIPEIRRALSDASVPPPRAEMELTLRFDPVCNMVVSPRRARASLWHGGKRYYFCSSDCLQAFTASHDRAAKGQPAEADHPVTM